MVGWASCDADPIHFIGSVVARHRDRPRVHGAHADCLDSPRALCRSNRIRTGDLPLRRRTLSPLSYGTLVAFPLGHTMRPRVGHPSDWRDSNPRPPGPQPDALPTAPQSARAFLPTGGDGTPLREPCDRRTCPACGENATFMPHPRRALGRIRTGDAHLRKVALYPLSYRGVCRLVARASQLVFRFDGIHVVLSLVAMALRLPRLSPTGMMVFIARSTRPLDCPSVDGPRDSTPRFLAVRRCDRASRGIRTHNPRFKRPLL